MSRRIGLDQEAGYRAITVYLDWQNVEQTFTEGIYNNIGTAKGRVSFWRRHRGPRFIKGWVERASTTWAPVEGSLVENEGTDEERGDQDEG